MTPWELLTTCEGLRAWLLAFAARHPIIIVANIVGALIGSERLLAAKTGQVSEDRVN